MIDLNNLLRKNIQNLKSYSSARNEFSGDDVILLDANENPKALSGLPIGINRYPDPLQKRVKEKLSVLKGISSDNIFLGNGSDEAIDLALRCFCNPGVDALAIFPPTYGMYKVCAAINDINVIEYPLNSTFEIDIDKFVDELKPEVKVVIICNPNNPTANVQDKSIIKKIIERFQGIVIHDEAYVDFCPEQSLVNDLSKYPNLIILQTLSKAWALAGARVGIAMASKDIIDVFNKVKFPYNISYPSLMIAEEALSKSVESQSRINEIIEEKERLLKLLPDLPMVVKVYPSSTNFILVKTTDSNSLYKYLIQNGIVVRNRDMETNCKGCIRITVGLDDENNRLIDAWKKYNLSVSL